MRNATRRNRNIGTKKSGWKKQTPFKEAPYTCGKDFLKGEFVEMRKINGLEIDFYADKLSPGYKHHCSVDDVCSILAKVPSVDLYGLGIVYFYQSTKKQDLFNPFWGCLRYYAGPLFDPVLVLSAQPEVLKFSWGKKLHPLAVKDLDNRIKSSKNYNFDGRKHNFVFESEQIRNIQLRETVVHEIGHWVEYKAKGEQESKNVLELEVFADNYVKEFWEKLV